MTVSLLIYTLFLLDSKHGIFWEELDDYIYYIRALGNTIEFLFGIFLFLNGAYIFMFESGGAIRAIMMIIHAYVNIWLEVKNGWRIYLQRRTAVKKLHSLKEATEEELILHDDVCAICYQVMKSARVTQCGHYYHSVCLRKWLYVQDNCPMCHKILFQLENTENQNVGSNTDLQ